MFNLRWFSSRTLIVFSILLKKRGLGVCFVIWKEVILNIFFFALLSSMDIRSVNYETNCIMIINKECCRCVVE
jgi:hypothetical protein